MQELNTACYFFAKINDGEILPQTPKNYLKGMKKYERKNNKKTILD
jgi:hypothetical protein